MTNYPEGKANEFQNKLNISIDNQNPKLNSAIKPVNIVPIKLNLNQDNLSRNKNTLETLSKRMDSYGEEISKLNKKHKVSFIDQISEKKNIAQIIYIDDQTSARDSKKAAEKYEKIFKKREIDNNKNNTNNTIEKNKEKKNDEIYKIKRPKRSKTNDKRKVEKVDEQCQCKIF